MQLKTVEIEGKTYAEISDGKPLYVHEDGKEVAFDAPGTINTITRLNGEAKGHREAKEAAEGKLKSFEGIDDPDAAKSALQTLKNLDDKKLVDAGEVERVKAEAIKAVEDKYKPTIERAETLERQLRDEKIGGSFARSKFITEKLAVPADIVQSKFGAAFSVEEDGRIVAKGQDGNPIYSASKPGEIAEFDEALEIMVQNYPNRDYILKGNGHGGGGARNGSGGGGSKTISRSEFEKMPPAEQHAKIVNEKFTVTD
ncbi:MAG: DUF6651 domain-containing protein [Candidatus Binatia bacterium]